LSCYFGLENLALFSLFNFTQVPAAVVQVPEETDTEQEPDMVPESNMEQKADTAM
jgi:hypothetical protein